MEKKGDREEMKIEKGKNKKEQEKISVNSKKNLKKS